MLKTPETSPLTQARKEIRREEETAIDYYGGACPNPDCGSPSLKTARRPSDEYVGLGPIFVTCGECGWTETGIDWQERTGKKLF